MRIDAGIDGLQQRLPLAASGFQRRDFCLALAAQPSELLLLAGNFRLHVSQLLEIDQQAIDALDARALEVAVVGQHACNCAHVFLLQQQLQLLVVTQRVGRAQQHGQCFALATKGFRQLLAALVERFQFGGLRSQFRVELTDAFERCGNRGFQLAQGITGFAAFSRGGFQFLAKLADLRAHIGEFALGLLGFTRFGRILRMQAARRHASERKDRDLHGPHHQVDRSTRLRPLISDGTGMPISASTLGARSRKAPLRRRASRPR